jgi:GTP cyclohydrolase III
MSRYTVILLTPKREISKELLRALNSLYSEISTSVLTCEGLVYVLSPRIILILSNGISKRDHEDIFQRVNSSEYFSARIASVISSSPLHAILTAMRILDVNEYYFQDSVEKPYTIGVFTLKYMRSEVDVVSEIVSQMSLFSEISRLLLSTGGLPLSVNTYKLISALRESALNYITELLTRNVAIGVGTDYKALRALTKAEENIAL